MIGRSREVLLRLLSVGSLLLVRLYVLLLVLLGLLVLRLLYWLCVLLLRCVLGLGRNAGVVVFLQRHGLAIVNAVVRRRLGDVCGVVVRSVGAVLVPGNHKNNRDGDPRNTTT